MPTYAKEFNWKYENGEFILLHGRRKSQFSVVPDSKYPKMWRVKFPDGALSDMVNLTRAKDAAIGRAMSMLNSTAAAATP